jgi:hypothetical protein
MAQITERKIMEVISKHLKIASERASTNPEVSSANSLAAIGLLLQQIVNERANHG